jgi:fused signal recognition particle receptor
MFDFLKKKLKEWIKPKEEIKVVKAPKKKEKKEVEKPKKPKKQEIKVEHKKRTAQELVEERKVGGVVIEDIKKEVGEEVNAIPQIESEEKEKETVEPAKETKEEISEPVEEKEDKKPEEKKSFWQRVGLVKKYKITEQDFSELFEQLENILLENNVALEAVDFLRENLKKELVNLEVNKNDIEKTIKSALKISIESLFAKKINILDKIKEKDPFVIVFFGINGSGKTTTIAKIASFLKGKGISSVLAAGDTFRAASIEQLVKHGDKIGVKVVKQTYGSDPAAVAYDAIEYAKAHRIRVVLIDTAGRMHTKSSLMKEMEKIIRVSKPDMKIFVAESTLGNDSIDQAKVFNEAIGIDGIVLSKADIDEKGGTSLSVSYVTGKPIIFLGTGQNYEDLEEFDKDKLIRALGL